MKQLKKFSFQCVAGAIAFLPMGINAQEIVLESSSGESYVLDINTEASFGEVVELINSSLFAIESQAIESQGSAFDYEGWDIPQGFSLDFSCGTTVIKPKPYKAASPVRDYSAPLTDAQKKDITYITNTLANGQLLKIKSEESSLKSAGDRILNVHPLQMLAYVFTTEELKVSMRNMQGKSFVWKEFIKGVSDSLTQENAKGNLLPFIPDFANRLNIDPNVLQSSIQSGKWEKFVDALISSVPRSGNTGRYNT